MKELKGQTVLLREIKESDIDDRYVLGKNNEFIYMCGGDRNGKTLYPDYIYRVTVAEKYRGRGIGQMFVDKSLQKLKEEGVNKCHLFVFGDINLAIVYSNTLRAHGNNLWFKQ